MKWRCHAEKEGGAVQIRERLKTFALRTAE
jgi:hypothetical protein